MPVSFFGDIIFSQTECAKPLFGGADATLTLMCPFLDRWRVLRYDLGSFVLIFGCGSRI